MKKTMIETAHKITQFEEWPKGLETSYHDWIIRASKTEIMKKLGFKPKYNRSGDKWTYQWNCCLDDGKYYFIIYDMSYGRKLGKDEVTEYHIGFNDDFNSIRNFFPEKIEAIDMLLALVERELEIDHSDSWKLFHEEGIFDDIERIVKIRMEDAKKNNRDNS